MYDIKLYSDESGLLKEWTDVSYESMELMFELYLALKEDKE